MAENRPFNFTVGENVMAVIRPQSMKHAVDTVRAVLDTGKLVNIPNAAGDVQEIANLEVVLEQLVAENEGHFKYLTPQAVELMYALGREHAYAQGFEPYWRIKDNTKMIRQAIEMRMAMLKSELAKHADAAQATEHSRAMQWLKTTQVDGASLAPVSSPSVVMVDGKPQVVSKTGKPKGKGGNGIG